MALSVSKAYVRISSASFGDMNPSSSCDVSIFLKVLNGCWFPLSQPLRQQSYFSLPVLRKLVVPAARLCPLLVPAPKFLPPRIPPACEARRTGCQIENRDSPAPLSR